MSALRSARRSGGVLVDTAPTDGAQQQGQLGTRAEGRGDSELQCEAGCLRKQGPTLRRLPMGNPILKGCLIAALLGCTAVLLTEMLAAAGQLGTAQRRRDNSTAAPDGASYGGGVASSIIPAPGLRYLHGEREESLLEALLRLLLGDRRALPQAPPSSEEPAAPPPLPATLSVPAPSPPLKSTASRRIAARPETTPETDSHSEDVAPEPPPSKQQRSTATDCGILLDDRLRPGHPNAAREQEESDPPTDAPKCGAVLFLHIPKTGGTALRRIMSNNPQYYHVRALPAMAIHCGSPCQLSCVSACGVIIMMLCTCSPASILAHTCASVDTALKNTTRESLRPSSPTSLGMKHAGPLLGSRVTGEDHDGGQFPARAPLCLGRIALRTAHLRSSLLVPPHVCPRPLPLPRLRAAPHYLFTVRVGHEANELRFGGRWEPRSRWKPFTVPANNYLYDALNVLNALWYSQRTDRDSGLSLSLLHRAMRKA
eukprot:scaffold269_cov404-Prasinococcus_capsulatus_cf.AAC.32